MYDITIVIVVVSVAVTVYKVVISPPSFQSNQDDTLTLDYNYSAYSHFIKILLFSQEQLSEMRESGGQEKSTIDLFPPVSTEFNFSTSVFGQLTNDLQKILGAGQNQGQTVEVKVGREVEIVKRVLCVCVF